MEIILARADAVDGKLRSLLFRCQDDALARAREADKRRRDGKRRSRWDGIPIGIKDIIAVRGQPMTCASRMLKNYISPYDATVIRNMDALGLIPWGRFNMDEFAMGSSTETSAFQITTNPWDLSCVPGGSSGGCSSAVAAGIAPAALGTDTGGSIRQPASFCNLTGVKPTYGRVSRYGVTAFASSLDQVGPLARSVEDAAILLSAIAGLDGNDSTSAALPVPDYLQKARQYRPWKIGIAEEFFSNGLDDEVAALVRLAIAFYEAQGCTILPISLPHSPLGIAVYYVIATAEAFSNLARFDGVRYGHRSTLTENALDIYDRSRAEGFGDEVRRRIILGAFVLSSGFYDAYYLRAQRVRTLIRQDYDRALRDVDFILTPTAPTPAFHIGDKNMNPLAMYLNDIYTVTVNLAGLPAISIPCGFTASNLPVGLQLIGKLYGEGDILAASNFFQKNHDYHLRRPSAVENFQ
jgi:aspartyl-tRNA(Asn)/glutamyl-tRNA(Gln) amidotransferase subunit A